ncbi:hypothetical protein K449DRAFT_159288 [Hypoxylon sp. EC38]|nr:hypothetical protein K449DRAFT_159288 [Hypoxylon sp. EC38]
MFQKKCQTSDDELINHPAYIAYYQALGQVVEKLKEDPNFKKASHALQKKMESSAKAETFRVYLDPSCRTNHQEVRSPP